MASVNVQTDMRRLTIHNKYMRSYPLEPSLCYDANNLYGWAMCQPLPYADFRWIDDVDNSDVTIIATNSQRVTYSRWIWSICNISMMRIPIYRFVQRARNYLASERTSSSWHCTIKNVTSYIIAICSNVSHHDLRITKIHRILQFAQSPISFASTSNLIQILEL